VAFGYLELAVYLVPDTEVTDDRYDDQTDTGRELWTDLIPCMVEPTHLSLMGIKVYYL